jgi:hypothetical protein
MAELAAPTKLLSKRMAGQAVEKQLLYNFLTMAELAAPTKLLYNIRVWHIISHFFWRDLSFFCFLF